MGPIVNLSEKIHAAVKMSAVALLAVSAMLSVQSCEDSLDGGYQYYGPNAIVTVKPIDDSSFYMQLDDQTTLFPSNIGKSPFGDKEVRALVTLELLDESDETYGQKAEIYRIDSILTKKPVPFKEGGNLDELYGNDPLAIWDSWMTVVEDGYITLHFSTLWGYNTGIKHELNLVTGTDPDNPYLVEFRHNAQGDIGERQGDGIVAFSLKDLPDTNGETVKLTLKWNDGSERTATFDYKTRSDWADGPEGEE